MRNIKKLMENAGVANDPNVEARLEQIEKASWPVKYKRLARTCALYYKDDANNCSVMTLALALDVSYGKAYAALKRAGREEGEGVMFEVIRKAARELGYDFGLVSAEEFGYKAPTLAKVRNAGGNRVAIVRGAKQDGHILSVRDGVIYDFSGSRKRVVTLYNVLNLQEEA